MFYLLIPLLLLSSTTFDSVGTLSWVENGIYTFSSLDETTIEFTNTHSQVQETLSSVSYEKSTYQRQYKITEIFPRNLTYRYLYSDGNDLYDIDNEYERTYAAEDFALDIVDALYIDFTWDEVRNETVFYFAYFTMHYFYYFVEPDWQTVNKGYKEIFNESRILEVVYYETEPYEFEEEVITVGDFFNNHVNSFSLMGKPTLNEGLAELNSNTTSFTFEMDLSGYLNYRDYNYSTGEWQYTPYRKAIYSIEAIYESGGILSSIKEDLEREVFYSDGLLYKYQSHYEMTSGLKDYRASLNLLYCLLGVLVLVPKVLKNKKKK